MPASMNGCQTAIMTLLWQACMHCGVLSKVSVPGHASMARLLLPMHNNSLESKIKLELVAVQKEAETTSQDGWVTSAVSMLTLSCPAVEGNLAFPTFDAA